MRRLSLIILIVIFILVLAGIAAGTINSILIGYDNAAYDYYNDSHKQFLGWVLCFAPFFVALIAVILFCFHKKALLIGVICIALMIIVVAMPSVYMIMFKELNVLHLISQILTFICAALMVVILIVEKGKKQMGLNALS